MKKKFAILITCLILSSIINAVFASNIGSYSLYGGDYRAYGLAQTLQAQKRLSNIQRQKYNYAANPLKRIKYPTSYNPYPNIQQSNYYNISPKQRYSARYYENMY